MGKAFSKNQRSQNRDAHTNEKSHQPFAIDAFTNRNSRKRRFLKQLKRDQKVQRVSKDQLHKLSFELTRTAWYLGRRLEFSEREVQKILWRAPNEQMAKRHILMTWRKRNGWKATNQNIIIRLELAGYSPDEYKCILPLQENGRSNIYKKVDKTVSKPSKSNGYFRYDSHIDVQDPKGMQSSVVTSADDIIEFARRSWKKPSKKQKSQEKAMEDIPQSARLPATNCPEKKLIRRYSESLINNMTKYGTESELDAIFRETKENQAAARVHDAVVESEDVISRNGVMTSHHEHSYSVDSKDSNLEAYREQIVRMSKRQYSNRNKEPPSTTKVYEEERLLQHAIDSSSPAFSFFKFSLQPSQAKNPKDQHISGLALTEEDSLILAESNNKEIHIFDKFGKFIRSFFTQSELYPKGVTVNQRNEIVVCCGKDVRLFSSDGELMRVFGHGSFRNNSYSVTCDDIGTYYVSDIVGHSISVFDNDGNIRKRFGNLGENLVNFNQPVAVAINERQKLFISDSQNHCVKVYSLAGRPLEQIGEKGSEDGKLWNPFGLCFDKRGQILIADCGNNRISMFDASYKFIRHVLTEADGLQMPSMIRVNTSGQLVVCEWKSNLVRVYNFETAV